MVYVYHWIRVRDELGKAKMGFEIGVGVTGKAEKEARVCLGVGPR